MEVKERNPGGDATGLVQSMQANGPDSLLRAENVGAVVRTFLGEVFNSLERVGAGQISRDLGVATVQPQENAEAAMTSARESMEANAAENQAHEAQPAAETASV